MMIGLLGRKHVGKDTVADYLVYKYKYQQLSFARPLKEGVKILFGFSSAQIYGDGRDIIDQRYHLTPREILHFMGTEVIRRKFGEDFWIRQAINDALPRKIIISDVRFQNEVDIIKKMGGIVIKLDREGLERDSSEDQIDLVCEYDHLIKNNHSVQELYSELDRILEEK